MTKNNNSFNLKKNFRTTKHLIGVMYKDRSESYTKIFADIFIILSRFGILTWLYYYLFQYRGGTIMGENFQTIIWSMFLYFCFMNINPRSICIDIQRYQYGQHRKSFCQACKLFALQDRILSGCQDKYFLDKYNFRNLYLEFFSGYSSNNFYLDFLINFSSYICFVFCTLIFHLQFDRLGGFLVGRHTTITLDY